MSHCESPHKFPGIHPGALISTKMIDVMKQPELASYLFITWALDIRCRASEKSVKDHNVWENAFK